MREAVHISPVTDEPSSESHVAEFRDYFPEPNDTSGQSLQALDGTSASRSENGHRLEMRSPEGQLLFAYDVRSGCAEVFLPKGDLSLSAPDGEIHLNARDGIHLKAGGDETDASEVSVDVHGVRLRGTELQARAKDGHLKLDRGSVVVGHLDTAYESVRQVAGLLETQARRIVESTKESFRHAEELQETKAGRVRWLVKGAFNLMGGYAQLKMDEDLSIDAEQIRLG